LPVLCNIRRRRATPYQSGLDATARTANLRAAFTVRQLVPARHVLIVDDVITTGATCRELARAARAAGAEKVSVLAVART
jgi:predicted amidophosphoribosyltransferase